MKYSSRIETITPAKAQEYLNNNTYNRPLSDVYVNALADQMKRGQWRMNGEPVIFSGSGRLLDGQHRLAAIVRSGVSVEMAVTRGVDEDTFATIDTGKGRTAGDVFAIAGIRNYVVIAAGLAKFAMMAKGYNNFLDGSSNYKIRKITRQDLLDEYYRTPELYQDISRSVDRFYKAGRLMKSSEIFAVMAYLIKVKHHSRHSVEAFFTALCVGSYSDCKTINIYRNMLIRDMSSQVRMTAAVKRNLLARTWNAYVQRKDLKRLVWQEKDGNIEFL